MLKDCEEFSQTNSRGRQKTGSGAKKSKRGSVRQQRTCSAELLPRVDEDQKEDAPEKDEAGKMHRQQLLQHEFLLDKNEFGLGGAIGAQSGTCGKSFNAILHLDPNDTISEDQETDKPEQGNASERPRKLSLSIFSSGSNSHANSPHYRKIKIDELEILASRFKQLDSDCDEKDEDEVEPIPEAEQENADQTNVSRAVETLGQGMKIGNRKKKFFFLY